MYEEKKVSEKIKNGKETEKEPSTFSELWRRLHLLSHSAL